ncbi:MAG: hypothetical protein ACYDBB_09240 [Armatimonadota bacterium]
MTRKHSQFTIMMMAIIIVGIFFFVGGSVVVYQVYMKYDQLQKKNNNMKALCAKIDEDLLTRPQLETQLAELQNKVKVLQQNLVDYKYIPTYLNQIQTVTVKTGNTIMAIRPSEIRDLNLANSPLSVKSGVPAAVAGTTQVVTDTNAAPTSTPPPAQKYLVQQISLDTVGDYTSTMRLLDQLRQFPKLVYVRTLSLSPENSDYGFKMRTHLETYAIIIPDQFVTDETDRGVVVRGK